jgi:hypothetical protein
VKQLKDAETDEYQLEVYECPICRFHIGIDATYLAAHPEGLRMPCPSCTHPLEFEGIE